MKTNTQTRKGAQRSENAVVSRLEGRSLLCNYTEPQFSVYTAGKRVKKEVVTIERAISRDTQGGLLLFASITPEGAHFICGLDKGEIEDLFEGKAVKEYEYKGGDLYATYKLQ